MLISLIMSCRSVSTGTFKDVYNQGMFPKRRVTHLLDGKYLFWILVKSFEHRTITSLPQFANYIKHLVLEAELTQRTDAFAATKMIYFELPIEKVKRYLLRLSSEWRLVQHLQPDATAVLHHLKPGGHISFPCSLLIFDVSVILGIKKNIQQYIKANQITSALLTIFPSLYRFSWEISTSN